MTPLSCAPAKGGTSHCELVMEQRPLLWAKKQRVKRPIVLALAHWLLILRLKDVFQFGLLVVHYWERSLFIHGPWRGLCIIHAMALGSGWPKSVSSYSSVCLVWSELSVSALLEWGSEAFQITMPCSGIKADSTVCLKLRVRLWNPPLMKITSHWWAAYGWQGLSRPSTFPFSEPQREGGAQRGWLRLEVSQKHPLHKRAILCGWMTLSLLISFSSNIYQCLVTCEQTNGNRKSFLS